MEFHRNVRNKLQRSNRALIAYYTNTEARQKREQERVSTIVLSFIWALQLQS